MHGGTPLPTVPCGVKANGPARERTGEVQLKNHKSMYNIVAIGNFGQKIVSEKKNLKDTIAEYKGKFFLGAEVDGQMRPCIIVNA